MNVQFYNELQCKKSVHFMQLVYTLVNTKWASPRIQFSEQYFNLNPVPEYTYNVICVHLAYFAHSYLLISVIIFYIDYIQTHTYTSSKPPFPGVYFVTDDVRIYTLSPLVRICDRQYTILIITNSIKRVQFLERAHTYVYWIFT